MTQAAIGSPEQALTFILSGKATVTFRSVKTGTWFTYNVEVSNDGQRHYVSLLSGPDNNSDYQFLGTIFPGEFCPVFRHGKKSSIGLDAPSAKAFAWTFAKLAVGRGHEDLEIWHEGKCGRCGLKLTTPESIARGIGPECWKKMSGFK